MSQPLTRRHFNSTLAAGAAGLLTAGYTATSRGFAANETINVACIGTGGRCRTLMKELVKLPGVRLAAVCDVWDKPKAMAQEIADPKAVATRAYRELLDRKDIDAVLIGTPDHWHVPITVEACAAGKDVYVEKPLTHTVEEGQSVIDAQNNHKRIVQVGTQQRSMPQVQKAREIIQSGQLGDIYKVHVTWNRNTARHKGDKGAELPAVDPSTVDWKGFLGSAPDQPFDPYRLQRWRGFWDFGGGLLTDLMVHFLDVAFWSLDLTHPDTAATVGDNFMTEGLWQVPDTVQTLMHFPDQHVQIHFESTFLNARNAAMIEFMGRDATLYLDRGRYEVIPEPKSKVPASELVLGEGSKGRDFYDNPNGELLHLTNWIECIRSRQAPVCPAEAGVRAAAAAHLANRSYRSGQIARWQA